MNLTNFLFGRCSLSIGCWTFLFLSLTAPAAQALSLAGNDNWADGVISGQSSESIQANGTNPRAYSWNDANGDGTPGDNVSTGFDLAGYNISPSSGVNSAGLTLNLDNGSGPAAITNSLTGGSAGDIVTRPGSDYGYTSGLLTITNATHITVRNLDLRGESGGGATIVHAGNLTVTGSILDHHRGTGQIFTLDGGNSGSLAIFNGISRVKQLYRDTVIRNYSSVIVEGYASYDKATLGDAGDFGINHGSVSGTGQDGGNSRVIVTNIGPGGISIPHGISTWDSRLPINRAIILQTLGPVNVGPLNASNGSWFSSASGGNIMVTAGGNIAVTGSINANNSYADSGDGILSLVATGASSVITVADLNCNTFRTDAGYYTFSGGGGKSFITGTLSNFDTSNSPALQIRAPAGQTIYYDPKVPGNEYLARKRYTLSGGGILRPPVSGTVVSLK